MKRSAARSLLCTLLTLVLLIGAVPVSAAQKEPSIVAESAIVIDYETGAVLYEKDADAQRVPASMTKMMTAYIIFEELEAGNLTPDSTVTITKADAQRSRDRNYPAMVPLNAGQEVSIDTLLKLILIPSASASCIVAANHISGSEAAFVERMNATAKRLGMTAAYENCHGAFPHYTTARAQARMVQAFIQRFPQILEYTSLTGVFFNGKNYPNTNSLLNTYEGCDGFKTGTIPAAGYCLAATAVRDGRRLISVVMKSSDDAHRFSDTTAILDYSFDYLANNSLYFNDVVGHWARGNIEALANTGTALHTRSGQFRPNEAVTRGEFAAMLMSALEPRGLLDTHPETAAPAFSDLNDYWAEAELTRAAQLGVITTAQPGLFLPDAPLTREQAAIMLDRAFRFPAAQPMSFLDGAEIAPDAVAAFERTVAAGVFQGDGVGHVMPQLTLSRADAAVLLTRLLGLV